MTTTTTATTKTKLPPLTLEDIERLTGEITEAAIKLAIDMAAMDEEINRIRAAHAPAQLNLSMEITAKKKKIRTWAVKNPEAFGDKRSIDFTRATVGFETSNPAVDIVGDMTEDDVIAKLIQEEGGDEYVRLGKATLDKQAIIRDREARAVMFAECGLVIEQAQKFYVTPKLEKPAEVAS